MFAARQAYFEAIVDDAVIDEILLELAYVAVSTVSDCEYCLASHSERLVEHVGLPEDRVAALASGEFTDLDERERAVVEVARQVASDPKRLSESDLDRLREHRFDDAGLVALVTVVSAAVAANTFADAFDVLPQDLGDGLEAYLPDGP